MADVDANGHFEIASPVVDGEATMELVFTDDQGARTRRRVEIETTPMNEETP